MPCVSSELLSRPLWLPAWPLSRPPGLEGVGAVPGARRRRRTFPWEEGKGACKLGAGLQMGMTTRTLMPGFEGETRLRVKGVQGPGEGRGHPEERTVSAGRCPLKGWLCSGQ